MVPRGCGRSPARRKCSASEGAGAGAGKSQQSLRRQPSRNSLETAKPQLTGGSRAVVPTDQAARRARSPQAPCSGHGGRSKATALPRDPHSPRRAAQQFAKWQLITNTRSTGVRAGGAVSPQNRHTPSPSPLGAHRAGQAQPLPFSQTAESGPRCPPAPDPPGETPEPSQRRQGAQAGSQQRGARAAARHRSSRDPPAALCCRKQKLSSSETHLPRRHLHFAFWPLLLVPTRSFMGKTSLSGSRASPSSLPGDAVPLSCWRQKPGLQAHQCQATKRFSLEGADWWEPLRRQGKAFAFAILFSPFSSRSPQDGHF